MKRAFILLLLAILLFNPVTAADASDVIEESIGINPETFQDPEQLKEEYLKQNWAELIAKNDVLGPIHLFLLKISPLFNILFGQPYSLSLVLLFVVVLWFFILRESYLLLEMAPFNKPTNLALAAGITIILAQINFLNLVGTFMVKLIISPEAWWMRIITLLVAAVAFFLINYGVQFLASTSRKSKQQKEKMEIKQTLSETKAFMKGVKQGQDIVN